MIFSRENVLSRVWGVTIQVAEEIKRTKRVTVSQSILIFFQKYEV